MDKVVKSYPRQCFAAWNSDAQERSKSASGGVGALFAECFIRRGTVYGTRMDVAAGPSVRAVVAPAHTKEELEAFKGSKYVRSWFPPAVRRGLLEALSRGEAVMFIGTPCQVSGLKAAAEGLPGRLITVDLICHGTASPEYLDAEIAYLARRKRLGHITDVRFRGNDGYNFKLSLWDEDRCVYSRHAHGQPYFQGYLGGLLLQSGCNSCPFATAERTGDMTIGDFIGLGRTEPFDGPRKNTSVVLVNTPYGEEFFAEVLSSFPSLHAVPRSYSERLAYRPGLMEPTPRHPLRDKMDRLTDGHPEAAPRIVRRLLRGEMLRLRMRDAWEWLHHQAHLAKRRVTASRPI